MNFNNIQSLAQAVSNTLVQCWNQKLYVAVLTCTLLFALGDDATPRYRWYSFVGQGLLKPWLNCMSIDR